MNSRYLPVLTVGSITLARCSNTLDMALILQTAVGPLVEVMSDEDGLRLGVEMIRESGRRAIRTEALLKGLTQALAAAQNKEKADETPVPFPDFIGPIQRISAGGNGPSGPGLSDLDPCTPRDLKLPGTEGPEQSARGGNHSP